MNWERVLGDFREAEATGREPEDVQAERHARERRAVERSLRKPRRAEARRLTIGRLQVYIEPRDAWIGVYVAPQAVYVLPVPFVVLRWSRSQNQTQVT